MIDIKTILEDYKPDNSLFTEEPDLVNRIKNIIYNKLDEPNRRIILLYAELGNYRDLAKVLNVSIGTVSSRINRIKNIIKEYL